MPMPERDGQILKPQGLRGATWLPQPLLVFECGSFPVFRFNPNRSLDRSNVLFSKVKLFGYLAHFCQPCLDVARYAFCKSKSNTQDMSGQSTQSLMTDLGLSVKKRSFSAGEVLGNAPRVSWQLAEVLGNAPRVSWQLAEALGNAPRVSWQLAEVLGNAPRVSWQLAEVLGNAPRELFCRWHVGADAPPR